MPRKERAINFFIEGEEDEDEVFVAPTKLHYS
jgi:hypothetical protein